MGMGPTKSEDGIAAPRAVGRIALAILLALAVALVVLPLGLSFAQGAPTIDIVNPNDTTSMRVSDKERPYELVAWVANPPAGAEVEFTILDGETVVAGPFPGAPTTGRPDTFTYDWTIDDAIAEGAYTLEATLTTGTPVTATQEIEVNQVDDGDPLLAPTEFISETAAISYPEQGGDLGVNGFVFLIEGVTSADAETVAGYYSISPTGTDPEFAGCGSATPAEDNTFVLTCTVAETDDPMAVNAVAVVPNKGGELPPPVTLDDVIGAADAHTVTAYAQTPAAFEVNPASAGNTTVATCPLFTASVADQEGRPIPGANVDVHAQGPDDELDFDVSGTYSDPNQAPDAGTHDADAGWACADPEAGEAGGEGSQGSHAITGESSRKHIESTDGTDTAGEFTFALRSATTGETQITAWVDSDDDDLLCDDEFQDYAAIGWGVPAPTPAGHDPEVESCGASPSPSTSPTASPSASPTATPSPEPEPNEYLRSVSLGFKHKGKKLLLKGRVRAESDAPDDCTDGVPVRLQRKQNGRWKLLKTVQTNDKGRYRGSVKDRKGRYRAIAENVFVGVDDSCSAARKAKSHRHRG